MLAKFTAYLGSRSRYFKDCWEHAQHHRAVTVITAFLLVYSVYSEYVEPNVDVPKLLEGKKLPLPWALAVVFFALFFIVLEGSYRKYKLVLGVSSADCPKIYLRYYIEHDIDLYHSGFFLQVEGEGKAFDVRVSSPQAVAENHRRISMIWEVPPQPIGREPIAIKARCEQYDAQNIPHLASGLSSRQIHKFFELKKGYDNELIASIQYKDVDGKECPVRQFKITSARDFRGNFVIGCIPVGAQAASLT